MHVLHNDLISHINFYENNLKHKKLSEIRKTGKNLLEDGAIIIGIDSINNYYSI